MEIIIRDYQTEDIRNIASQQKELIQFHMKYDNLFYQPSVHSEAEISSYLKKKLKDNEFKIFIAEYNTRIIGYVMGWLTERPPIYKNRKTGYLSNIFIEEDFRNKKVGKKLYLKLEEWFKKHKVNFIEIKADSRNNETLEAFRHYGFTDLSITFYKKL